MSKSILPAQSRLLRASVWYQGNSKSLPDGYPSFHARLYALDLLVPGIDLHQKSKWYLHERRSGDWRYRILAFGSVAYFVICWLLTLIAIGAVTGLLKPH